MDLISQHLFSVLKKRIQIGKLQGEKRLLACTASSNIGRDANTNPAIPFLQSFTKDFPKRKHDLRICFTWWQYNPTSTHSLRSKEGSDCLQKRSRGLLHTYNYARGTGEFQNHSARTGLKQQITCHTVGTPSVNHPHGSPFCSPEEQALLSWHLIPDAAVKLLRHQCCTDTFRKPSSSARSADVMHLLTFQSFRRSPWWWRRAGTAWQLQGVRDISSSQIFQCRNLEKVTSSLPQLPLFALLLTWMWLTRVRFILNSWNRLFGCYVNPVNVKILE